MASVPLKKKTGRPPKQKVEIIDTSPEGIVINVKTQALLSSVQERFGKGAMMRAGSTDVIITDFIPFGHPLIDDMLGGGIARGRVAEVYGGESAGKSTAALILASVAQQMGLQVAYIDVEQAFDVSYARALGVNTDNLLISQPDSGEDAMDIALMCAKSGEIGLIILDSVAALMTRAELEASAADQQMAQVARLLSKSLKPMLKALASSNCAFLCINQLRENPGAYGGGAKTTGGRALKYYASQRMELTKIETVFIPSGGDKIAVGQKIKVKIPKNKVAPPLRQGTVELRYHMPDRGQQGGFDVIMPVLEMAIEKGIVTKKGAWFAYDGSNFAQGQESARKHLIEHPEFLKELQDKLV